ncbi:HNH endonuclease [Aeromonas veronii]
MESTRLNYYFISLNGSFEFSISANSKESLIALKELHAIFFDPNIIRKTNHIHHITMKIKEELRLYTIKFRDIIPQINQLHAKISRMACGEGFAILKSEPTSTIDKIRIETIVWNSNGIGGIDTEIDQNYINEFKMQLQHYNFFRPRVDIRVNIGPQRRQDRKCRFCGKTNLTGATFRKVAHAIPESIGNKNIITNEECDSCNEFFGITYEKSLVEYFNFHRVINGVKSKEGHPKISYKNGHAFYRDGIAQIFSEEIIEDEQGNIQIKLRSNEYFNENFFYKALCKIALSIIDVNELPSLQNTINWLMDKNYEGNDLPFVGQLINSQWYTDEPRIAVITRVNDFLCSPHVLCELSVGFYKFIYILPYSERDKLKYSTENEMLEVFKIFPQFSKEKGWIYKKYEKNVMKKMLFSINLKN